MSTKLLHYRLRTFSGTDAKVPLDLLRININQAMCDKRTSAKAILESISPTTAKSDPFPCQGPGAICHLFLLSPDDARMSLTRDTLQTALHNVNSYLGMHARHPRKMTLG